MCGPLIRASSVCSFSIRIALFFSSLKQIVHLMTSLFDIAVYSDFLNTVSSLNSGTKPTGNQIAVCDKNLAHVLLLSKD